MKALLWIVRIIQFCSSPCMLLAPLAAHGITVDAGNANARAGISSSMAIVAGRPAIAYADDKSTAVKFVRAADVQGAAWAAPVTVDSASPVGGRVSLFIAGGNPAICYLDLNGGRIKFARALNATGDEWDTAVTLDAAGVSSFGFSAAIVDGNPAVCFLDTTAGQYNYIRSSNAAGSVWPAATALFPGGSPGEPVMMVVQGRPYVLFTRGQSFWYQRATDAAGTFWDEPALALLVPAAPGRHFTSMQLVSGRPAICYFDITHTALYYVRAADDAGTLWGTPVALDIGGADGRACSLAVVDGKPAIAYYMLNTQDLHYLQATDSDGMTAASWNPPVTVDNTGDTGVSPSLLEVDARPAVAYHNATAGSLKYLRAVTDSPAPQWPSELLVEQAGGTPSPDGGTRDFGGVSIRSVKTLSFILSNPSPGSVPLTNVGATIDGKDAAEFHIITPPPAQLAGGEAAPLTVSCAPVTPGLKSAVLHITSSLTGAQDPWDISLTASSIPDISVERPFGVPLEDGATITIPPAAPGGTVDLDFRVKNTGGADLKNLFVTIDGPDAGAFNVIGMPPGSVPPGGVGFFNIRHSATDGGQRATLRITSNVDGGKSPYDITITVLSGSLDGSFNPAPEVVTALALQPDGSILAGGRQNITRFNPNGTPDLSFFAPPLSSAAVNCLAVQNDGKILLGGDFTMVGGQGRGGLARLLPDGTLDPDFVPEVASPLSFIAIQPDGRILAGGGFTTNGGIVEPFIARLHPDGSRDSSFNCRPNDGVSCVALMPDGRILIGGRFTSVFSTSAPHIARLDSDGSPDPFAGALSDEVLCLAVQPAGRILVGGRFPGGIARLFPDGTRDTSVAGVFNSIVNDLALQTDGGFFAAGPFASYTGFPRGGVARIHSDGSPDLSFDGSLDVGVSVQRLSLQADGRLLIGGVFLNINGMPHINLARLVNARTVSRLETEGFTTLRWWRSGSTPEIFDVTFEVKTGSASDWTLLGRGTRISGGWQLTGLKWPGPAAIRARGRAGGSIVETVSFLPSALETWRAQFFNTSENTGDAADEADPDHDGLTNFVEFAFGLSPIEREVRRLPEFKFAGSSFTASFAAPPGRENLLYSAEWSPAMQPGTWSAIPDSGAGSTHIFHAPAAGPRVFTRFVVRIR
jgi:uncharacterized delta-60 repeat protein